MFDLIVLCSKLPSHCAKNVAILESVVACYELLVSCLKILSFAPQIMPSPARPGKRGFVRKPDNWPGKPRGEYECYQCEKRFARYGNLANHLRDRVECREERRRRESEGRQAGGSNDRKEPEARHICSKTSCGKKFVRRRELDEHMLTHTNEATTSSSPVRAPRATPERGASPESDSSIGSAVMPSSGTSSDGSPVIPKRRRRSPPLVEEPTEGAVTSATVSSATVSSSQIAPNHDAIPEGLQQVVHNASSAGQLRRIIFSQHTLPDGSTFKAVIPEFK